MAQVVVTNVLMPQEAAFLQRLGRVETWRGDDSSFRFHVPLIEPDGRISRIRLSDKDSCVRPREVACPRLEPYQPQRSIKVFIREL